MGNFVPSDSHTMIRYISAAEAVQQISSHERVFIQAAAATPMPLIQALADRAGEITGVHTIHMHLEGETFPLVEPGVRQSFHPNAIFIGTSLRAAIADGHAQYLPIFLSEVPALFRKRIWPVDAALIQVSPPDQHGFCSLGTSVDITRAAVESARKVIALVNPQMPRSHGDGLVHIRQFTAMVYGEQPLYEHELTEPTEIESAIGRNVAALVDDGACIQMGIGGIPNAVLQYLTNHRNLGVHTEMFSDGLLPLVESGVVTGRNKRVHPGKIVSAFAVGSRKLYDFIDDNPGVAMLDIGYVNDTSVIRKNPKVTAINSAIEIDLTGQVCADSIGTRMYSGVGGQMDFIRGATLSDEGKAIIAIPSVTARGESKIVPMLKQGAGVVTTRAHIRYVVTEHGIADLYGKNLAERAAALIRIAHPDHQEALEREAFHRFRQHAFAL